MDLLLRTPDRWEALYSCRYLNESEWQKEGSSNVLLGFFYIFVGIFFIVLYALCVTVMCQKHIRQQSCLKFMIQIGVMDMANLLANCLYTGYLTVVGAVFCTSPLLQYCAGAYIFYVWTNSSLTSVLLCIDRALEAFVPQYMEDIFGGYRIWLWLGFPHLYALYFAFFTPAPSFSSKMYAWFFDPYVGIDRIPVNHANYISTPHVVHNIGISVVFSIVYIAHFAAIWWKTRMSTSEVMGKTRKRLFVQSMSICSLNSSACVCYVLIEQFAAPKLLMIVAHALWICCNCGPVVIYLTLNKTIRNEFLRKFLRKNVVGSSTGGLHTT